MNESSRLERLLAVLSGPPVRRWPDAVMHTGSRVVLLATLGLAVTLLFPAVPVDDFPVLEEGMVAEKDIIAEVAFPVYKPSAELQAERREAAAAVVPIFDHTAAAVDTMLAPLSRFMAVVDNAAPAAPDDSARHVAIASVLVTYGLSPDSAQVALLGRAVARVALRAALDRAVRSELGRGIASTAELEEIGASQVWVRSAAGGRLLPRDSVATAASFYAAAARHLPRNSDPLLAQLHRVLLVRFFEPSVRLNREATEAERERVRQAVPALKGQVLKGERIVAAHERVGTRELERLNAYRERLAEVGRLERSGSRVLRSFGAFLVACMLIGIFGLLLYFYRRTVYHSFRQLLVVAILILALLGFSALIARLGWPLELVPIAVPALVVAALWDGRMALNLSLVLTLLLAVQTPFLGATTTVLVGVGGAAAGLSVRVVRRRAQTWAFAAIVAGAYALAIVALGLLRSRATGEVLDSVLWGALNAVGSALVAMGSLPLFEALAGLTTDQTLLELTDLNRPLLKRLSLEANGTYHHSLNVANLAEAASRRIGANALLARVGAYYHDVGKIAKPQYFIENQPQGRNPHDKLKPASSAAIVRNHVLEGLRLAEEYKLPASVRAFIAEHHGTQPISYFFDRAREQEGPVNPREFVYPGPRPQSRETALTMLADSVESAARVLPDPTPEGIRELVDRIVNGKIAQGQLEETPLTMGELSLIKEEFAAVLTGMKHHRIDYPPTREPAEAASPQTVRVGGA